MDLFIFSVFITLARDTRLPHTVTISAKEKEMAAILIREKPKKHCPIFRIGALLLTLVVWSGNCFVSCYCSSHLAVASSILNQRRPPTLVASLVRGGANSHPSFTVQPTTASFPKKATAHSSAMIATTATSLRAGASSSGKTKCPVTKPIGLLSSFWGSFGVIYILYKAIARVLPIALEPFKGTSPSLTSFQLAAYIGTSLFFAYAEGYKGFQLKFSPLVVCRSFNLGIKSPAHHVIFAPAYSMGLFHATRKRMIVSWSVTTGVAVVVALVKRLPYPWRNIVDAGVVVGLTWGSLSIAIGYFKALFTGKLPDGVDPALPIFEQSNDNKKKD
mmetsp:Transcript_6221/g.9094  ORF Transcript_6221/g.9094 Transcript_6221/m.9094 type:complete len:331 (+) Transcript_6221:51-1043(+)